MSHSRRDTLKFTLVGGLLAAGGNALVAGVANAAAPRQPSGPESVRPAVQPKWKRSANGQRLPDLGDGRFINPIIPGAAPDPDIVKDGADYYMTFSSFQEYPGLPLYHSRDLVNWVRIGSAVNKPVGSIIAPSIVKHNGRFFIYFPAGLPAPQGQGRGTYVVWADNIRGPWSDPIQVQQGGGIDPGHAVGEDGKRYLFLSRGTRVRLTDDGLKADGPIETVYAGWQYPEDWYDEAYSHESPKIFKRGDYFYQVSALGGTYGPPTSHMVVVARSRSIHGPWENDPANPIMRTRTVTEPWWSRGHGVVVQGPAGDWWMAYHAYENGYRSLGRQTLLEPVEWTRDGWLRVSQRDLTQPIRSPRGGQKVGELPALSDDFSTNRLGSLWRIYRPEATGEYDRVSLADRTLTLRGKGDSFSTSSPLTCVPTDRAYECTVETELVGEGETGLMLFIGATLYAGLGHDGTQIKAYHKAAPRLQPQASPTRRMWLKLINDHQILSLFTSTDGATWTRYPLRMDVSDFTQNVTPGGGESLRIGLYAVGPGSARFRNFTYRGLP